MPNPEKYNQTDSQLEGSPLIISNLLKKYNLKELDEDFIERFIEDKERDFVLPGGMLLDTAVEIVEEKISKKELVSVLKERLEIPESDAKKLAKDIEETLIPEVRRELEEIKKRPTAPSEEKPILVTPIKPPIGLGKVNGGEEIIKPKIKKPVIPKKIEKVEKIKKFEKPVEKKPEKPDVYREPIE